MISLLEPSVLIATSVASPFLTSTIIAADVTVETLIYVRFVLTAEQPVMVMTTGSSSEACAAELSSPATRRQSLPGRRLPKEPPSKRESKHLRATHLPTSPIVIARAIFVLRVSSCHLGTGQLRLTFQDFPENEFVTCTVCDDFHLCTKCFTSSEYGHHPAHPFRPVVVDAPKMTSKIMSLCDVGRGVVHHAVCDGCEEV